MQKKSFYITTTLPYVNAEPHIGFAMEIIRADIVARWKKLQGFDVFFNTGTDEHGQKIADAAKAAGISTKKYIDEYSKKFRELKSLLGLSDDIHFIRTTDPHHEKAAQEFWRRVDKAGYIYRKNYKTKYCVGCELEKTDSELVDGKCPIHPNLKLEIIEEENYFFKFSEFCDKLIKLYDGKTFKVVPDFRLNEMREFVKRGLEDFSISRLKSKMSWGIPVPEDENQVMYVWFDALVNYISALGWPKDEKNFKKFWQDGTPTQYCGKDNTRFQAAMWQAMLMAAGLPPTATVVVDGFITGEGGVKMSKSLGNTISPVEIVREYGTEALRYFLAREVSSFEDSPFTMERFKAAYNSGLANGLGNLVSRIMKMATSYGVLFNKNLVVETGFHARYKTQIQNYDLTQAMGIIFELISLTDSLIQQKEPFKKIKINKTEAEQDVSTLLHNLYTIADMLEPFMPETSATIKNLVKENKMPDKPLFARKE